ncbi:hypothetical protein [Streptococcus suis]|uniref:hypothetical protein n=1 Tax=Streptococcus suis TaxID=1307 RepID=UPI000CF43674|nr:hypothetical protein [Streptococcus suis]
MSNIKNRIEYRKGQTSIIWILISATIVTIFFLFLTQPDLSRSSTSSSTDLSTTREQYILDAEPMTLDRARIISPKMENETDAEYQERLQEIVDTVNERMEERKSSIRRQAETVQTQNNEFISPIILAIWGITAAFVIGALISNYLKSRQPIAIVMTEEYIEFKAGMFREEHRLYWNEIAAIEYSMRYQRRSNSGSYSTSRYLYFKDVNDTILDRINLNSLENSDFNSIHRDISSLVPDMNWIYP